MQSTARTIPVRSTSRILNRHPSTRKMSLLFPYHRHQHHAPAPRIADFGFGPVASYNPWLTHDFQPFASLFNDTFNELQKLTSNSNIASSTWAPKFNVKETEEAYQLEGELPGVEQKDVSIEFVDDNTLTIKGRTETVREEGQRPQAQAQIQQAEQPNKEIEQPQGSPKQATVEDEVPEASGAISATETTTTAAEASQTTIPTEATPETTEEKTREVAQSTQQPQHTYWISERHVGSFQRSFAFPAAIDYDAVKASLKNGVLNMVIPKKIHPQEPQGLRKVEISD